jgi:predicted alpha/beta-hydrolase family hydrolase
MKSLGFIVFSIALTAGSGCKSDSPAMDADCADWRWVCFYNARTEAVTLTTAKEQIVIRANSGALTEQFLDTLQYQINTEPTRTIIVPECADTTVNL